jgi:transposase
MPRKILRDDQYARIEAILPGKGSDAGVTAKNRRLFAEAVLWIARTGAPWRDLPKSIGRSIVSGEADPKGCATASYRQF